MWYFKMFDVIVESIILNNVTTPLHSSNVIFYDSGEVLVHFVIPKEQHQYFATNQFILTCFFIIRIPLYITKKKLWLEVPMEPLKSHGQTRAKFNSIDCENVVL